MPSSSHSTRAGARINVAERQIDQEYRERLLEEARRGFPEQLPGSLVQLRDALDKFVELSEGQQGSAQGLRQLTDIRDLLNNIAGEADIRDASRLPSVARQMVALESGELQELGSVLISCIIEQKADGAREKFAQVQTAVERFIDEQSVARAQQIGNLLGDLPEALDTVSTVLRPAQRGAVSPHAKLRDAVGNLQREIHSDPESSAACENARTLIETVDVVLQICDQNISGSVMPSRLRQLIRQSEGKLPELPEDARAVSLARLKDAEVLEQLLLNRVPQIRESITQSDFDRISDLQQEGSADLARWTTMLAAEVSGWEDQRFSAASKALFDAQPKTDPLVLELLRREVEQRFGLDEALVVLAESFYDRAAFKRSLGQESFKKSRLGRDLDRTGELAEKTKLRQASKHELVGLARIHIGQGVLADISEHLEAGLWRRTPKETVVPILRQVLEKKMAEAGERIEQLREVRSRQFRTEDVLAAHLVEHKELDMPGFRLVLASLFEAGVFSGDRGFQFAIEQQLQQSLYELVSSHEQEQVLSQAQEPSHAPEPSEAPIAEQPIPARSDNGNSALESTADPEIPAATGGVAEAGAIDDADLEEFVRGMLRDDLGLPEEQVAILCAQFNPIDLLDRLESAHRALTGILTPTMSVRAGVLDEYNAFVQRVLLESVAHICEKSTPEVTEVANILASQIQVVLENINSVSVDAIRDLEDRLHSFELLPLGALPDAEFIEQITAFGLSESAAGRPSGVDEGTGEDEEGSESDAAGQSFDPNSRSDHFQKIVDQGGSVEELSDLEPGVIERVARVIYKGWFFQGSSHPFLKEQYVRRNAGMKKDGAAFAKVRDFLRDYGIIEESARGYGIGLSSPDNFDCSDELKEFVQSLRDLRHPHRS